nr:PREDICTED: glycosyltransferase 25 family member [Bemisia tabaci]
MNTFSLCLVLIIFLIDLNVISSQSVSVGGDVKPNTLVIAFLVRNKAHTLPYFLTLLENLNYPKQRIKLWIRSDHNVDNSIEILDAWLSKVSSSYSSINTHFAPSPPTEFKDEEGPTHWSESRFTHIMRLREEALMYSRETWADYLLFIDCDVFLTYPDVIQDMVSKNYPLVSPVLQSSGLYSNFWGGMTSDFYYYRSDDYESILFRKEKGCFKVPMIHSCVFIDLRYQSTDKLSYLPEKVPGYHGPHDDIITFALAANLSGIPLHVCNENTHGFVMVPLERDTPLESDESQLTNIKLEVLLTGPPLSVSESLSRFVKKSEKTSWGLSRTYLINLERRPERRKRMMDCFDVLGLEVTVLNAVDGSLLDETELTRRGVQFLPGYRDPYHKRPMTKGEIGCFLSHFRIWKEIVEENLDVVMVLEDDVRFEHYFKSKLEQVLDELRTLPDFDWDFVYLGRKRLLQNVTEDQVIGSEFLRHVSYSYWTIGYLISLSGAQKLLAAKPLNNLLPVDEFLPIMYNQQPQESWAQYYPERNLLAYVAEPLLLYPALYVNEPGYVSDTENSTTIKVTQTTERREEL